MNHRKLLAYIYLVSGIFAFLWFFIEVVNQAIEGMYAFASKKHGISVTGTPALVMQLVFAFVGASLSYYGLTEINKNA